eukprot:120531-Amphidinium_carterae.2
MAHPQQPRSGWKETWSFRKAKTGRSKFFCCCHTSSLAQGKGPWLGPSDQVTTDYHTPVGWGRRCGEKIGPSVSGEQVTEGEVHSDLLRCNS